MPTQRPSRRRKRRTSSFTAAELQFLTGQPQSRANRFELRPLEFPRVPADFDRIDGLLSRADGIIAAERITELQTNSAKMRRFRADPNSAATT